MAKGPLVRPSEAAATATGAMAVRATSPQAVGVTSPQAGRVTGGVTGRPGGGVTGRGASILVSHAPMAVRGVLARQT